MRQLAQAVGDAAQMCEAISAVLRNHATPTKTAQVGTGDAFLLDDLILKVWVVRDRFGFPVA